MSIDYNDPPRDFLKYASERDDVTGVQCRVCLHAVDSCRCELMCCPTCGGPRVAIDGKDLTDDDSTECPLCDRIPPNNKTAALYQAAERPAFNPQHWTDRVLKSVNRCGFDECLEHEEVTKETRVPTMAELIGLTR